MLFLHLKFFWLVAVVLGKFSPLSYDEMTLQVSTLCKKHPTSCRLTLAQEEFLLPSPGQCGSSKVPCTTQILQLTNFSTFDESEKRSRPEIYISGELHGDERVGPHATLEFARVLLEADNIWVQHLLNTRSIFITPLTNSLGFDQNRREENNVDPNRDYPIDQDSQNCMRAVTSRIVNELYRAHLFQLAITFHGGMEAIAVEWGTTSRLSMNQHKSPDDFALLQLGGALSKFSGPVTPNGRPYPVGRMNDLVYPVPGGMEDWAYAGNWDPLSRRTPCNPSSFGGYSKSQTEYSDDMLRAVNILVETSDSKWPSDFGKEDDILNPQSGTGHVARNVRLALALTDLIQPYIVITYLSIESQKVLVKWEVSGSFHVDETEAIIFYSDQTSVLAKSKLLSGATRWFSGAYADRGKYPFRSNFQACFDLSKLEGSEFELAVRARVDSSWIKAENLNNVNPPNFLPQSHFVNARTNPNWLKSNSGRVVQGRLDWYSERISFQVPLPRMLRQISLIRKLAEEEEDLGVAECVRPLDNKQSETIQEPDFYDADNSTASPFKGQATATLNYSFVFSGVVFCAFIGFSVHMYQTRKRTGEFVRVNTREEENEEEES